MHSWVDDVDAMFTLRMRHIHFFEMTVEFLHLFELVFVGHWDTFKNYSVL